MTLTTDLLPPVPRGHDEAESVVLDVGDGPLSVKWGREDYLGSCAYWIGQAQKWEALGGDHRLGADLTEEVVACILGGFGMSAEVGLAAFHRMKGDNLIRLEDPPTATELMAVLSEPLLLPDGRHVRYRYPSQRAHRLAQSLRKLSDLELPEDPVSLRDALLTLDGVGPKTASWIVRNQTGTDRVAIIDVHVRRAGLTAGFFRSRWQLPRDYSMFERAFLAIAVMGGISAAQLDACIWAQLHRLGPAATLLLGEDAFR